MISLLPPSSQVIRNEALVLMINLTRSAQEIQKIGADGGIVVQVGERRRGFRVNNYKFVHSKSSKSGTCLVPNLFKLGFRSRGSEGELNVGRRKERGMIR